MKIAIIEPHYDDAWLNLGGYILKNQNIQFKIISVCDDKTNKSNETKKLEKILPNIKTVALHYKGIPWALRDKLEESSYSKYSTKINKKHMWSYTKSKILDEIKNKIKNEIIDSDIVFLPFGGKHPQHIIISQFNFDKVTKHYLEFPYSYNSNINLSEIIHKSKKIDISDVIENKICIFKKVYKTQIMMLNTISKIGERLEGTRNEFIFCD